MKVQYTPESREDLRKIRHYISKVLGNPSAAKKIAENILKSCHSLRQHPHLGFDFAEKTGLDIDLRCLICGNFLILYRIEGCCISVFRILDGRTDYMREITGL